MNAREEAIEKGNEILKNINELLRIINLDLNSKKIDDEVNALIGIKAIDAFLKEETGLCMWMNKVEGIIKQQLGIKNEN